MLLFKTKQSEPVTNLDFKEYVVSELFDFCEASNFRSLAEALPETFTVYKCHEKGNSMAISSTNSAEIAKLSDTLHGGIHDLQGKIQTLLVKRIHKTNKNQ